MKYTEVVSIQREQGEKRGQGDEARASVTQSKRSVRHLRSEIVDEESDGEALTSTNLPSPRGYIG